MKIEQALAAVSKKQLWITICLLCCAGGVLSSLFILGQISIGGSAGIKDISAGAFATSSTPFASTTQVITLQAGEGIEYKLDMEKDKAFVYTWNATDPLYTDMHAEPTEDDGKAFLPFKSYEIATTDRSSGSLVTEFTGIHGWYWQNESDGPVTVTVTVSGFYKRTGLMTGGH